MVGVAIVRRAGGSVFTKIFGGLYKENKQEPPI